MAKERLIVIGGDGAGMSAASRTRKLKPDMEITVFQKSGYVSYAACGIPYFIADEVKSVDKLVVYDARFFSTIRNINVLLHHEAIRIFPQKKSVLVKNLETGEAAEHLYDKLLISTGARPFLPPIKGKELKGIFTVRALEDGEAIKEFIHQYAPRNAVILGAGSIGMEMAESFTAVGLKVTIVEKMPSILGTMDDEISKVVEDTLVRNNVRLIKSKGITEFAGDDSLVKKAILDDGETLEADIAIIGAGIRPNSELAIDSGIELAKSGAIKVNRKMQTSIADIYAAGDCAEAYHLIYERNVYMPLALTANKQGRVAGENIAGENVTFAGIIGSAVFKVFDLEVARTGLTEKDAINEGINYATNTVEHFSRASYYPGSGKLTMKLLADKKTGRILGAQAAGNDGITHRINILASAITAKMNARDVAQLDLGYAPPFNPVFDAVIIAAEELRKKIGMPNE